MPEILRVSSQAREVIDMVREEPGESLLRSWNVINRLTKEGNLPQDYIGHGAYSLVMGDELNPKIVHAIRFDNRPKYKAEQVFNINKILCTLFPFNFPKFHSMWFSSENYMSGSVRQRIYPATTRKEVLYPFGVVSEFIESCNYIPLYYEKKSNEFRLADDGGVYYLDEVDLYDTLKPKHINSAIRWMKSHCVFDRGTGSERPFHDYEIDGVLSILGRL